MQLKKVLACGMLLGLLSGVSFAQHMRLRTGGTMPGARLPNTVHGTLGTPSAGSVSDAHQVRPNATTTDNAKTVKPNTSITPDRPPMPDTPNLPVQDPKR